MNSAPQTIRERAASSLDVAPTATAEEVRAAFLLRLASGGFVQREESIIAANTLGGTELPLSPNGKEELESLQRDAVEAFANSYWSLEPARRRIHWQELTKEVIDIQAKSRLAGLENGLGQIEKEHINALVNEIASAVRELYVLGPRDRVVRRTSWLEERCDRFDDFHHAARRLSADEPELAKLEPELLRELTKGSAFEPIPAIDSAIAEAERSKWAALAAAKLQRKMVKQRLRAERTREETSNGGSTSSKLGWVVVPIIIAVVRVFIGLGSHTDRTTTPTYPSYRADQKISTQDMERIRQTLEEVESQRKKMKFTDEETQRFIAYEQHFIARDREEAGETPPLNPPSGYQLWVRAGRPGAPADLKQRVPR
jgi:hypothetical protein